MPSKPLRPCPYPLCPGLVASGYCDAHKGAASTFGFRGTANSRGYTYEWQRFRLAYLRLHPLCVDCEKRGIVTLATDVHHINKLRFAPGLKYDAGNLMALCSDHHDERTRRGE